MTDYVGSVKEFHETFGHPVRTSPTARIPEALLRASLIKEELGEYIDALAERDTVGVADALADLLYVVFGAALAHGIPIDEVFAEVHRSNMTKLGEDGKPIVRADGKALKGPNYEPPRIREVMGAS